MSIPRQKVGLEHFKRVFATIDRDGVPAGRASTTYDLVFDGKRYPPKYAIALAVVEAGEPEPAASSFEFGDSEQRWVQTLGIEVARVGASPAASAFPLSDDAIRAEWQSFIARRADEEPWMKAIRSSIALAQSDRETFYREDTQRALWSADDAIGVGMGLVDVKAAYTNAAVIDLLWELRTQRLPDDVNERAEALRKAFDRLVQALKEAGVKRRPRAKLLRLIALLLPREGTTLLSEQSLLAVWKRLFATPLPGFGPEAQVLIRARLRELLGDEADHNACVDRMVFCWLLQNMSERAAPPQITQLPFDQQYKGIPASSGFSESLRAMVREAQEPVRVDDLFAAWQTRTGKEGVSRKTFEARLSTWRTMGFLRLDVAGRCQATEDGLRLLDDDELLITRLIEHVFGFAETLWFVADSAAKGLSSDELLQAQQRAYPNWTTAFAPNALTKWVEHFGLIERGSDARWRATDDGRSWVARIRRRTAVLPPPSPQPPVGTTSSAALRSWDFAKVAAELASKELVIDAAQLRALHAGWNASPTKHFVLLSGLSGTGKTQVVLRYARAVCAQLGLLEDTHITLVAVSPDWHDPSALLGYVNPLHDEQTFVRGAILPLLLHAAEDPTAPHFLVLDEMNLAPVERYFAPLLSAMESGSPLQLHNEDNDIDGVPASLRWPSNLFIAGTVNLDETTHAFSDKVLDRAFTLEYWRVDLPAFFAKLRASNRSRYESAVALACTEVLETLYNHLEPTRRQFGYRSAREILDFVIVGVEQCGGDASEFIDMAVFGKVLPRIRGEDTPQLRAALEACIAVAKSASLARCEQKLRAMHEQLLRVGMTKFAS